MRIFIKELELNKLNLKKLDEYKFDIKEKILILTEKNILKIKNQEIYKIKPIGTVALYSPRPLPINSTNLDLPLQPEPV